MSEKLVKGILGTFGGLTSVSFGKELLVFIISLLPILELRGGLLAAALLGLDPLPSYIISIVGNLLPIPFILLLINKILDKMRNGKKRKKIFLLFIFIKWVDLSSITFCLCIKATSPTSNNGNIESSSVINSK